MSKDKVQKQYLKELKKEHGWKRAQVASELNIMISGASKENSIGKEIIKKFTGYIKEITEDVIGDEFYFNEPYTTLIMCHGYTYMDWLENVPDEETARIIDTNLYGSIRLVRQFVHDTIKLPYRKKIISIGSMAYNKVLNGSAAYCASKAGLNHFIRCAAWELAPKGFDVYIIHPSNVVDTPMTNDTIEHLMRYRNLDLADAKAYWGANSLRESLLTKDEIVQMVEFIVYNDVDYLSGCPIELNGGNR
jgi:NAD(P)-dependent dehydrogenase (short-subunit alcohol dehydrogenase family)